MLAMEWIPFQRPQIPPSERVEAYFRLSREAHWFSNEGPCVTLLGERLVDYVGRPLCCTPVCSGTTGLMISLRAALGASPDAREVIVPSFTYIATVSAVLWAGLTQVFADVARPAGISIPIRSHRR